jgi:hypothetical protein
MLIDPSLPPEGLGTVLAPTGPFFFLRSCFGSLVDRLERMDGLKRLRRFRSCVGLAAAALHCACTSNKPQAPTQRTEAQQTTAMAATSQPQSSLTTAAPRVVRPTPGIVVYPDRHLVEVDAWTCLDDGYLEQVACSPESREHESLVVVKARPSDIHAALLMAGFNAGSPGRWTYDNNKLTTVAPTGDKVDVAVRVVLNGKESIEPIRNWISEDRGERQFPDKPWVFGGSGFARNPKGVQPEGGEHYLADMSGSIIGLVTFGDEVVGFSKVFADEDDVQAPEWIVNSRSIPPVGTAVTLLLQKHAD